MRVGIDGGLFALEPRGHAIYALRLCRELGSLMPDSTFFVYTPRPIERIALPGDWRVRSGGAWSSRLSSVAWLKSAAGRLCRSDRLDVFWSPYSFLPSTPRSLPTLLTIYDFTYLHSPGSFHALHQLAFRACFRYDARRATEILTISEGTRAMIRQHLGRDALLIRPGLAPRFGPQRVERIEAVRRRFGLASPYILSVAAWDPRKNYARLVRCFLDLKRDGLVGSHELVLVGRRERAEPEILELLRQPGAEHVRCLGYVADDDLPALYAGATVFAFPSLYEGFGMPIVEAQACGTVVVTSDLPELREAGGEECLYVQTTEAGIRAGLVEALQRPRPEPAAFRAPSWAEGGRVLANNLECLAGASR